MTAQTNRLTILRRYTRCSAECRETGHVDGETESCQRCGAPLHVWIWVLGTPDGDELHVGDECFRDLMGYRYGVWHERAEQVAREAGDLLRPCGPGIRVVYDGGSIRRQVRAISRHGHQYWSDYNDGADFRPVSWRASRTLLRAGADLGLWAYDDSQGTGYVVLAEGPPLEARYGPTT